MFPAIKYPSTLIYMYSSQFTIHSPSFYAQFIQCQNIYFLFFIEIFLRFCMGNMILPKVIWVKSYYPNQETVFLSNSEDQLNRQFNTVNCAFHNKFDLHSQVLTDNNSPYICLLTYQLKIGVLFVYVIIM